MPKFIDLTGKKVGRLTVQYRVPNKNGKVYWHCVCDCGNEKDIRSSSLVGGGYITQSCGCLNREISSKQSYKKQSLNIEYFIDGKNEYEFTADTCIGYTRKGEIFLVDIDKYDLVKDICWRISKEGYVLGNLNNLNSSQKRVLLHRIVTNCPSDMMVDHIRGKDSRFDNRSCNLRICTNQQNQYNKLPMPFNSLGVKGVNAIQLKSGIVYRTQIAINGKIKHIGCFKTLKEASDAYDEMAIKYFGEFALLNNYKE